MVSFPSCAGIPAGPSGANTTRAYCVPGEFLLAAHPWREPGQPEQGGSAGGESRQLMQMCDMGPDLVIAAPCYRRRSPFEGSEQQMPNRGDLTGMDRRTRRRCVPLGGLVGWMIVYSHRQCRGVEQV